MNEWMSERVNEWIEQKEWRDKEMNEQRSAQTKKWMNKNKWIKNERPNN